MTPNRCIDRSAQQRCCRVHRASRAGARLCRSLGMELGLNPWDAAWVVLGPLGALASLGVKRRWVIVPVIIGLGAIGFALGLAALAWDDARIVAAFDAIRNPTDAQMREFNADGATKAVVFLFGFPFSVVYACVCVLIVRIARRAWQRLVHA